MAGFSKLNERKNRQKAERYGRWSELIAALYLRAKGYRILARNYRTRLGEIDIIAKRGKLIVIAEVKARKNVSLAADAVDYNTQQRISAAADQWIVSQQAAHHLSIRFDIIAVTPWSLPQHLKDAF